METKKYEIKKKDSKVSIEIIVDFLELEKHRNQVLKNLNQSVKIDGFRTGHIPEDILIKQVGEIKIINDCVDLFLSDFYPEIVFKNKLQVISRPSIVIKKLAPGNPFEAKIEVDVLPDIDLGDYKKIAKDNYEKANLEVSEQEINDFIEKLKKAHINQAEKDNTDGGEKKQVKEIKNAEVELTDDLVKTWGSFTSVLDFKQKIKSDLIKQKEHKHIEKVRSKIFDALVLKIQFEVPESLVEMEQDRTIEQMKEDISKMGLKFDEYLKHIDKTVDSFRQEAKIDCIKRVKIEFLLRKIAEAEKIQIKKTDLDKTILDYKKHSPQTDEKQAAIIVESHLKNQKVFELLENQK